MQGFSCYHIVALFVIAINVSKVYNICEKREVHGELSIAGIATFIRECCGCRVSSVSERELRIHSLEPSSQTRSIYVPEIRSCECIPCDANVYTWADYFLVLNHKRRK